MAPFFHLADGVAAGGQRTACVQHGWQQIRSFGPSITTEQRRGHFPGGQRYLSVSSRDAQPKVLACGAICRTSQSGKSLLGGIQAAGVSGSGNAPAGLSSRLPALVAWFDVDFVNVG